MGSKASIQRSRTHQVESAHAPTRGACLACGASEACRGRGPHQHWNPSATSSVRGVQAVSVHDRLVQRVGFTCSPEVLIHSAHRLRSACRPTCGACLAACTGEACAEETHHPRGLPVARSGPVSWHELTVYTPHRLRRWAARAWASKHSKEQNTSGRVSPCTHPWRLSGLWRQ